MKVLHVLDTSVPDTAGYTTRGYYLAMNQKKMGWEPVILTSERFSNPGAGYCETIEGIRYYRTLKRNGVIRKIPLLAESHEVRTLCKRIAEVADIEKIDIIHAHSPSLIGAACADYCLKAKIPFIYEVRAFWEDAAVDRGAFSEGSLKYRLRRYHETRVVKKAQAVVAICDGIKNDLLERGIAASKVHVIRNGVDPNLFQPLEPDTQLAEKMKCSEKIIVGFIGSFFHFEGLHTLIKAMTIIREKRNDIILMLVGTGQVDDQLRRIVKDNNLMNEVIFTGRVPHSQVSSYYSIIDIVVYPRVRARITELVTPLKPLEAMAMGKTVLVSDVGGLAELVGDKKTAVIYNAGDINSLAESILDLVDDEGRRRGIGSCARKNVMKNWDWKDRANQGVALYEKILSV